MISLKESLEKLRSMTYTLESAGLTPTFTVPAYKCSICGGAGWVYPSETDIARGKGLYGKAVPCFCLRNTFEENRRLAMLKFCGMPKNAKELTFENFKVTPANEIAYHKTLELVAGNISFLTLIGDVNKGKTHLAVSACHAFLDTNIPAKYLFVPAFLDEIRSSYDRDADYTYNTLMKRYSDVPLLVLDDLYAQKQTEWGSEKLVTIVNARYMERKTTIFTSNKSLAEINEIDLAQGERITSRLQRESWCAVVVIV